MLPIRPVLFIVGLSLAAVSVAPAIRKDPEHARPPSPAPPKAEVIQDLVWSPPDPDDLHADAVLASVLIQKEQDEVAAAVHLQVVAALQMEQDRLARSRPAPRPVSISGSSSGRDYGAIAACESGGDWSYNGPSGFDGGLQFLPSTWIGAGGGEFAPYAYLATPEQQMIVADRIPRSSWPNC